MRYSEFTDPDAAEPAAEAGPEESERMVRSEVVEDRQDVRPRPIGPGPFAACRDGGLVRRSETREEVLVSHARARRSR